MNERFKSLFKTFIFLCITISLAGQNLPPKQAYPLEVRQIHSGHSLTDPLFGQPWPGQFVELITLLRGEWAGDDIGKSTIPGSSMVWRWNHSSGYPDARHDISEFELLSITEVANMCYPGGNPAQWYQDCIQEQRDIFSTWVNHAWNNGNNGNGAATLLWTNWINIDGSDGPFREKLDTLGLEWEMRQDIANANRPAGATHVYIIPGHRMMARLYDDVQAGIVPDIVEFSEFFSDNIHTNALGDYAIAMIHYACIFNQSPVGLPNQLINNPPPGTPIPSQALANYIQNMVWDVVTNFPRTGVYATGVSAHFTASPQNGVAPLSVSFDASGSQNYGSGTLNFDWDFGDGNTGIGEIITHSYQNPGTYLATLTVTNDDNDTDTATASIVVTQNPPPVAVISATPNQGLAPLTVNLDGSGSIDYSGNGLSYLWNFGDGSPELTGVSVQHVYTSGGQIYTATLTVSDGESTSTATQNIEVLSQPASGPCQLLAFEDFSYPIAQPLHSLTGGSGWAQHWRVQNGNAFVPGYQSSSTNESLAYLDLKTAGIHASGGREWLTAGRRLDTSIDGPFAQYVTTSEESIGANRQGDTLWFSTLLRKNGNNQEEVYIDLTNSNIPECNSYQWCSDERIGIGYFGSPSDINGEQRWSLRIGETVYPTSVAVVVGETAFLVASIAFHAGSTGIDLYVNPSVFGDNGPPGTVTLSQSTSQLLRIRSLAYFSGSQPGEGSLDEIRFADSYRCVAPDSSVIINSPPVAVIAATPTSGQFPLSVHFDGTSSFHPDGLGFTYLWNFGDGSPAVEQDTVTHIYTIGPGQITATLTVTATDGQQNTASVVITLLDENNSFPCLSTVTCLQMADCNGENAHIRVNTKPSVSFALSQGNNPINPQNGNEYQNLSVGIYQLEINGNNGCSEAYDIYIQVDSTRCESWSPHLCSMDIGTNLPGFADWEPHRAMRNFMKNSRGKPIPYSNECGCWSFDNREQILQEMNFDNNGYPIGIPQVTTGGDTRLRYFVSSEGRNMVPGQTYLLLYEGAGTISISGAVSNVVSSAGRIQFDLGGNGTFWFQIVESQATNHIRNIRVVRLADEFEDIFAQPFYQEFLNKIEPFSYLRFMDWMATNNNPIVEWDQRPLPSYFSYGTGMGVPYEIIVKLANLTGKDIWLCVPHAANTDFIQQMAEFFRDSLNENINIYLEYSNEVWNWIFQQAQYNINNNPLGLMYGRAYSEKAKNVFRIWHEVFQGQECRVKRVVGLQARFNYLNEHIMAHFRQDEWDYGSPTHYFGLDHGETGNPRLDLLGVNATVQDIMNNAWNRFLDFKGSVNQDYRNVHIFGKEVITYEGGQHFVGNVFGTTYPYQQAMWDAQSSPEMYDMYIAVHDSIKSWGCKLATNFSLAGPQESVYGSWGVMEHIDVAPPYMTTAPKYQALLDLMPNESCRSYVQWLGLQNNNWSNRCNWSTSKVPNENNDVFIQGNVAHQSHVNQNAVIRSLQVSMQAILTVLTGYSLTVLE